MVSRRGFLGRLLGGLLAGWFGGDLLRHAEPAGAADRVPARASPGDVWLVSGEDLREGDPVYADGDGRIRVRVGSGGDGAGYDGGGGGGGWQPLGFATEDSDGDGRVRVRIGG